MINTNGHPVLDVVVLGQKSLDYEFDIRVDGQSQFHGCDTIQSEIRRINVVQKFFQYCPRHAAWLTADELDQKLLEAVHKHSETTWETDATKEEPTTWPTEEYDLQDLMDCDLEIPYIIPDVMDAVQPMVIGGVYKGMKTSLLLDMALSIASGTKFLGHFEVAVQRRVGFMTGEAGIATIAARTQLIVERRKINSQLIREFLHVTPELPNIGKPAGVMDLLGWCERHQLTIAIVDPAYLAMPGMKDYSANVYGVGETLRAFSREVMKRGVLPVPCHHSIKVPSRFQGEPLELSDLSGSGWSEFAGQWFLVNRYEPYVDGSQHHVLNLRIGGRSGHSSLWLVDINERTWDVVVRAYTEAKADAKERAEWEKRRKQEAVEQDQRRRVLNTFEAYPEGEGDTKSVIAAWAGMSAKEFNPILASLLRDQVVEEFEITKGNGRRYTGYRKVGRRQQSDTPTDFKSE